VRPPLADDERNSAGNRRNLKISLHAIKINGSRKVRERRGMGKKNKEEAVISEGKAPQEGAGFFSKYGPYLVLGGFILYVILLAIGTVAEVFKIQPVLDWWIWRVP
jgi:hypothetical protein